MFYIICYDTPSNRRRRKLHKLLKDYGVAVQKSVFESFLSGPAWDKLQQKMELIVDSTVDSVRVYILTKDMQRTMKVYGIPGLLEDLDHLILKTDKPEVFDGGDALPDEVEEDLPDWL